MNVACNSKYLFGPTPWGPGEGSKGQISLISITKSISKILIPNCVCILTNERYTMYQMEFSFKHLDHAPGVVGGGGGGGGAQGVKKNFEHDYVAYQIDEDDEQN